MLAKLRTAISHPDLAAGFAVYQVRRFVTGRRPAVLLPFGGRLRPPSFSQWRGTRAIRPTAAHLAMIRRLAVRPGDVVLDIGANIGMWSVMLAKAYAGAQIYAFEPAPSTRRLLEEHLAENGATDVRVERVAVSDRRDEMLFEDDPGNILNRLLESEALVRPGGAVVRVPTLPLDDFCDDRGVGRVRFAKVEVEGAELKVLRGARRLLAGRRIDSFFIEIAPDNMARFGDSVQDVFREIEGGGYRVHAVDETGGPGERLSADRIGPGVDALCVPAD